MTAPAGDDQMRQTRTCNPIASEAPKQGAKPSQGPIPRILQSADEAPCGSLIKNPHGATLLRLPNGEGWNLCGMTCFDLRGWRWDQVGTLIAEGLTEAECRHLSGLSAQEAIAWCERRNAHAALAEGARAKFGHAFDVTSSADAVTFISKPRPQPGDVVPWAEVEDGCLYFDREDPTRCPFAVCRAGGDMWLTGPNDGDLLLVLRDEGYGVRHGALPCATGPATLIARDLGSDPEAWRRAMREWTADGNKPTPDLSSMTAAQAAEHLNRTQGHVGTFAVVGGHSVAFSPAREVLAPLASFDTTTWTITTTRPAPAANVPADLVGPLRAAGVIGRGVLNEATPERVIALALERIEADRREIERLRTANVEARRALETPGRQGLRARLAKAEADLVAQRDATRKAEAMRAVAEHQAGQLRATLRRCNEADEAMIALAGKAAHQAGHAFGGTIPAVKEVILTLSAHVVGRRTELTREVSALAAQRDEARRVLAEEKIKTTNLDRALARQTEDRRAAEAGAGQATMLLNAWQRWARPLWPEGPPNPADAAIRSAIEGRVTRGIPLPNNAALARLRAVLPAAQHDDPSAGRTPSDMIVDAADLVTALYHRELAAKTRADKAERNLRAAADLLAA